jgi:protein-L-isoaspartate(D-aspartate) O-methyltransferase
LWRPIRALPSFDPRIRIIRAMDYAAARHNMVESQLRTNKVIDERLIEAMARVPREAFLPDRLKAAAYVDEDVPLGGGRFLVEPMVFARLVQAVGVAPGSRVLLVGVASGYAAAVLCAMGAGVLALEAHSDVAANTKIALSLNRVGAAVVEAPFDAGWPAGAPYDAILFDGAVGALPDCYAGQVAEDGRIAAVVAAPGEPGRATVWRKFGGTLTARVVFDATTPVLPGLAREPGFSL